MPDTFRFSVKLSKQITHVAKLIAVESLLDAFLEETSALGGKRSVILVQVPPKLQFVTGFFELLRERYDGLVACEPRHVSWFTPEADAYLQQFRIARVAADPPIVGFEPGGWRGLTYYRLHGSPRMYHSAYDSPFLSQLAQRLPDGAWCIFDNTASGAAVGNALELLSYTDRAAER